ncbi:winged helix-turn-helix domain-containing protein [Micromonospora sp. NBC_01699]|uniref:ArsR/SmtB family transcription factor n=1 Tax=Micromonospora sp. NBC_01699 TaxID=2975984 RepID=UPI002E2A4F71|nr:winged helix-turn-helix domain-containing protein [Micromonospora sp. NBC_01699]
MHGPATPSLFGGWRDRVRRTSSALTHPAVVPPDDMIGELFPVSGPADTFEEGLEALLRARAEGSCPELVEAARVAAVGGGGAVRRPRARGGWSVSGRVDRRDLVRFLCKYHQAAVAPYWPQIQSRLRAEHATYAGTLAAYGVEAMFAGLPSGFNWRSPILEIGRGTPVNDLVLDGRGLLLVPSAFYPNTPGIVTGTDDRAPVVLFVPVVRTVADATAMLTAPGAGAMSKALAALLGRTRASALEAVARGACTTGQLAERLAASLASASEHATVLRRAGLISTIRQGKAVLHVLTPLGADLLNGTPRPRH